jgi:hypothetical protein
MMAMSHWHWASGSVLGAANTPPYRFEQICCSVAMGTAFAAWLVADAGVANTAATASAADAAANRRRITVTAVSLSLTVDSTHVDGRAAFKIGEITRVST